MRRSFKAKGFRYKGEVYSGATLSVDDASRTVDVLVEKGLFRKKQQVIASLTVTETPAVSGPSVSMGEAVVELLSESDAKEVADLLYVPQVESALRAVEMAAEEFLSARSSAFRELASLRSDPRGTLLSAFKELPGSDPVEALVSSYSDPLREDVGKFRQAVESSSRDLNPELRNAIYAAVYAIGLVQNSLFQGDDALLNQSLKLLEEACPGGYPSASDLRGRSIEEATSLLLKSFFACRQAAVAGERSSA